MAVTVEALDRLQSQLLTSGLQDKNFPLYQVISQLIGFVRQGFTELTAAVTGGASGGGSTVITQQFIQQLLLGHDCGDWDGMMLPGPPGVNGVIGRDGAAGPPGFGVDGEDGDYYLPMPGPQGNPGPTGAGGPGGPQIVPNDGEDGDPAWVILQNFNNGGSITVHAAQVILTDAQIKTMSSVPIEVVPAPAANQQYHVIAMISIKDTTAGAYSAASTITCRYAGVAVDLTVATNVFLSSANKRWAVNDLTAPSSNLMGLGLGLVVRSSGDVTGGNAANYMAIQLVYAVITDGP